MKSWKTLSISHFAYTGDKTKERVTKDANMLKRAWCQRRNEKLPVAACRVCDQQVVINSQGKGATLEKSYQTRALRQTPGGPVGLFGISLQGCSISIILIPLK